MYTTRALTRHLIAGKRSSVACYHLCIGGELTTDIGCVRGIHPRFVPPRYLPNILISHTKRYNSEERQDERNGAADVPPFKNETEICRIPGE